MALKVCIIGMTGHSGYVTKAAEYNKDFYISAVSDGPEKAGCEKVFKGSQSSNPDVKKYEDYIEMLDTEKPDIAVVNPYCGYNAQVNIECLKRNIHVFSEKPVATELDELEKLKEAYYAADGVVFASMMAIRYTPWFAAAKKAIDAGAVGDIRLMNAQKSYRLGKRDGMYLDRKLYGGTILWVGSHAIDWLYWLSGKKFEEVFAVHSSKANKGHNDLEVSATCNFRMEDEVAATASIDFLRPAEAPSHDDDRVRVVGSTGVLEVRGGQVYLINENGEQTLPLEERVNPFDEVVKAVLGNNGDIVKAEDTFYVTEACIRARMSADEKKVISFNA